MARSSLVQRKEVAGAVADTRHSVFLIFHHGAQDDEQRHENDQRFHSTTSLDCGAGRTAIREYG